MAETLGVAHAHAVLHAGPPPRLSVRTEVDGGDHQKPASALLCGGAGRRDLPDVRLEELVQQERRERPGVVAVGLREGEYSRVSGREKSRRGGGGGESCTASAAPSSSPQLRQRTHRWHTIWPRARRRERPGGLNPKP